MKKIALRIIGGVITLFVVVLFFSKAPEAEHFPTQLHDDLLEGKTTQLSDYTDFDWDRVVIVSPYHNNSSAWDKIGYVWLGYLLTPSFGVDEAWYHWIFLKEGTVVAYANAHHVTRMDDEDYVLPHSLPEAPVFDGREFTPNDVLELQTWEHESYPLCRHQLVASGTKPEHVVGVRRFDTLECSPDIEKKDDEWTKRWGQPRS